MTERRNPAFEPLVSGAKDGVEAGYRALEAVLDGLRESTRRLAPPSRSRRAQQGRSSVPPTVRVQAGPSTARTTPTADRPTAHVPAGGAGAGAGAASGGGRLDERFDGLVGLLADALHYASEIIDELGDVVGGLGEDRDGDDDGDERGDDRGVPSHELTTPAAVPGGRPVSTTMYLHNHAPGKTPTLTFRATDLTSGVGDIGRERVSFEPESVPLGPTGAAQVTISVQVPKGTTPGTYRGTVHAVGSEAWGLLVVEVVEHHRLPEDASAGPTTA
jgi:hypothetical protein